MAACHRHYGIMNLCAPVRVCGGSGAGPWTPFWLYPRGLVVEGSDLWSDWRWFRDSAGISSEGSTPS